jgi:hypothetical protein
MSLTDVRSAWPGPRVGLKLSLLEFDPANIPYADFERIALNWLLEAPVG